MVFDVGVGWMNEIEGREHKRGIESYWEFYNEGKDMNPQ
jgi:hypothetical protein